jgi:hypothetical protein
MTVKIMTIRQQGNWQFNGRAGRSVFLVKHRNKMIKLLEAHHNGELSPSADVYLSLELIEDDEINGL